MTQSRRAWDSRMEARPGRVFFAAMRNVTKACEGGARADEVEKEISASAPEPATGPGAWGQGTVGSFPGSKSGARRPGLGFKGRVCVLEGVMLGPQGLGVWGLAPACMFGP